MIEAVGKEEFIWITKNNVDEKCLCCCDLIFLNPLPFGIQIKIIRHLICKIFNNNNNIHCQIYFSDKHVSQMIGFVLLNTANRLVEAESIYLFQKKYKAYLRKEGNGGVWERWLREVEPYIEYKYWHKLAGPNNLYAIPLSLFWHSRIPQNYLHFGKINLSEITVWFCLALIWSALWYANLILSCITAILLVNLWGLDQSCYYIFLSAMSQNQPANCFRLLG